MDVQAAVAPVEPRQHRVIEVVAAVAVRLAKHPVDPGAQHAHRRDLEPSALHVRRHDDDLRAAIGRYAPCERFGDALRREVLVLAEDRAARRGDGVERERADLVHPAAPVERRLGASDRNLDIVEHRIHAGRPRRGVVSARGGRARRMSGRAAPTLARELGQRARAVARHDGADVVEGRIRLSRLGAPARLVAGMRARVPADARKVIAADERDGVVDDDELLVMRRAGRMPVVEAKRKPAVSAPVELVHRQPFALECVEHREIPRQHVTSHVVARRNDRVEEIAERLGQSVVRAAGDEPHPAVDVPAEDEERVARLRKRRADGREVRLAVDEKSDARRALDAPAVAARLEQRRCRRACRVRSWRCSGERSGVGLGAQGECPAMQDDAPPRAGRRTILGDERRRASVGHVRHSSTRRSGRRRAAACDESATPRATAACRRRRNARCRARPIAARQ